MSLRNTILSLVSIALASQVANYLIGKEEEILCDVNINDNTWRSSRYHSLQFFHPKTIVHTSQYVRMRDDIEIAVDTYIPQYFYDHIQEQIPSIIYPTRHGRAYTIDFPFHYFSEKPFMTPRTSKYIERFTTTGYAWITVDIRGTGASKGAKIYGDFSPQEVLDAYDIMEWIISQPWSNGEAAAIGHGLDGTGVLLYAASQHPALKAISLNGAPYDLYDAAYFPGGVKNIQGITKFTEFTSAIDKQERWKDVPTFKAKLWLTYFGGNVYPVDPNRPEVVQEIIQQHKENLNGTDTLQTVRYRDDLIELPNGETVEWNSLNTAYQYLNRIGKSKVAILSFGGYYDMGTARSAIELYQYLTDTMEPELLDQLPKKLLFHKTQQLHRLILGPWSHAGVDNADPFAKSKKKCFWHLDEISRFFDYHLYSNRQNYTELKDESPIQYYTIVGGRWKGTDQWPPLNLQTKVLHFGKHELLLDSKVQENGVKSIDIDQILPRVTTVSRWDMINHLFGLHPFYYNDREKMEGNFVSFLTSEIENDMEITGEASLRLYFSFEGITDQHIDWNLNLVAYIEDCFYESVFNTRDEPPPRLGVTYITEATLNPIHQTVSKTSNIHSYTKQHGRSLHPTEIYETVLNFQPISYLLKQKHKLRITIGLGHPLELEIPGGSNPGVLSKLSIYYGDNYPTALTLPIAKSSPKSSPVPMTSPQHQMDEKDEL